MRGLRILLLLIFAFLNANRLLSDDQLLRMAVTTSTDNTGFLDYIAPYVESDLGILLEWIAVGTGKALELGKNCDVDVVMVHAPEAEKQYVEDGYGVERLPFMFNDFVIVGAREDPAEIGGKSLSEALRAIASEGVVFVSRGDESGTHKKEKHLWRNAHLPIPERQSWYIQTGQGMLATLNIAAEQGAYALTDRGTFIKFESNWKGKLPLAIHVQGDALLMNQYTVLAVNPKRCTYVRYDLAHTLIEWLSSRRAQKLIGEFRLMGERLFTPNANR